MTPPLPAPTPAAKPLLVVRNLVKAFPNGANVLNGVSLDVFAGDVFTVLGGAGCGESTPLYILLRVGETPPRTLPVLRPKNPNLPPPPPQEANPGSGVPFL